MGSRALAVLTWLCRVEPQTIAQLMEVWELRALAAGRDSESRAFPAGFVGRRAAAGFPPLLVAASYGFLFLFIF